MEFQGEASVILIDPLKLKQEQQFKTTPTQAEWGKKATVRDLELTDIRRRYVLSHVWRKRTDPGSEKRKRTNPRSETSSRRIPDK